MPVGKNSNAHKHLGTLALDLQRERELDAKRAARRAREARGKQLVSGARL